MRLMRTSDKWPHSLTSQPDPRKNITKCWSPPRTTNNYLGSEITKNVEWTQRHTISVHQQRGCSWFSVWTHLEHRTRLRSGLHLLGKTTFSCLVHQNQQWILCWPEALFRAPSFRWPIGPCNRGIPSPYTGRSRWRLHMAREESGHFITLGFSKLCHRSHDQSQFSTDLGISEPFVIAPGGRCAFTFLLKVWVR